MVKLSQLKSIFTKNSATTSPQSSAPSKEHNNQHLDLSLRKGGKELQVRVHKVKDLLRLRGGNGESYDVFISCRFSEAEKEARTLQQALQKRGKRAFLCDFGLGDGVVDAILEAFEQSKLAVIMGTAEYGKKGNTLVSTKEEMELIFKEQKPFCLLKMCDNYQEQIARAYLTEDVPSLYWKPGTPMDYQIVETILSRVAQIEIGEERPVNGFGSYTFQNGTKYIGMWKDGQPHGIGRQEYFDGSVFEGSFDCGLRHGLGKYSYGDRTTAPGDYYEGNYVRGKREGQGKYVYGLQGKWAGDSYIGNWKAGSRDGYGTYFYKGGAKYDGQWLNGVKQGKGVYTFAGDYAGDIYSGDYVNNAREGQGEYRYKNGDVYVGGWKDNKKHGKGVFFYHDGNKYDGEYKEGQHSGYGEYYYGPRSDRPGDWYKGQWLEGKKHGKGTYYSAKKGKSKFGQWQNDQPNYDI